MNRSGRYVMSGDAKNENTCCAELTHFCTVTSLKGVARAVKTPERWLRSVWIAAVVIFLGVTVYNVYSLTSQYLMYQSGTKIIENSVDFIKDTGSDVMLCNINPFSLQQLNRTMVLQKDYRNLVENWTRGNNTLNDIRQELITGQMGLYQHIGALKASRLSHKLKNFILSCYIHFVDGVMERKIPCSRTSLKIQKVMHKEYFNCYKIYGDSQTGGSRPSTGLSFLLYVDDPRDNDMGKDLAIQKIGKGVLLTVGERRTFLDPDSDGVEIIPNMVNIVRFKQNARKRLPTPYGDCKDRNSIAESMKHNFSVSYLYTRSACYSACVEYHMIKICKCQDVGQYGTLESTFKNISMCGATDEGKDVLIQRMKCVQKLRNSHRITCLERCPSPCEERKFAHQVSYLELLPQEVRNILSIVRNSVPNEINKDEMDSSHIAQNSSQANRGKKHNHNQNFNTDKTNIDVTNIAWVHLKREANSYYMVEDIAKMTFADYLAKIGGTCNLWSGITVFVLVELLDLVCRLCKRMFSPEIRRDKSHSEPDAKYSKSNGVENLQIGCRL